MCTVDYSTWTRLTGMSQCRDNLFSDAKAQELFLCYDIMVYIYV